MLKLERKKGEKVYVGPKKAISIEVLDIDLNEKKVLLGFEAPKDIDIYRHEVYERKMKQENFFNELRGSSDSVGKDSE